MPGNALRATSHLSVRLTAMRVTVNEGFITFLKNLNTNYVQNISADRTEAPQHRSSSSCNMLQLRETS